MRATETTTELLEKRATRFYPELTQQGHAPGITLKQVTYPEFTFALIFAAAGSGEAPHSHPEPQFGMPIRGAVDMQVGEELKRLRIGQLYAVPPNVTHAGFHPRDFVGLMVKGQQDLKHQVSSGQRVFWSGPDHIRTVWKRLASQFYVGSWFEVMLSDIPAGGKVPDHHHEAVQIGLCFDGRYEIEIEGAVRAMRFGGVYICPSHCRHSATNPYTKIARTINIFMPPHYYRR